MLSHKRVKNIVLNIFKEINCKRDSSFCLILRDFRFKPLTIGNNRIIGKK